jgi:lipopolysaccharide biosynthesis regulator YciM
LGFNKFAASSSSHAASTSKIMFVKPKMEDVMIENLWLPKEISEEVTKKSKSKFKVLVKTNLNSKFIHTCYHCGVKGHTCPNCFQIRAKNPWSQQNFLEKMNLELEIN